MLNYKNLNKTFFLFLNIIDFSFYFFIMRLSVKGFFCQSQAWDNNNNCNDNIVDQHNDNHSKKRGNFEFFYRANFKQNNLFVFCS